MPRNRRGNITTVIYAGTNSVKTSIPAYLVAKYKIFAGDELEWNDDEGYIRFKRLKELKR